MTDKRLNSLVLYLYRFLFTYNHVKTHNKFFRVLRIWTKKISSVLHSNAVMCIQESTLIKVAPLMKEYVRDAIKNVSLLKLSKKGEQPHDFLRWSDHRERYRIL